MTDRSVTYIGTGFNWSVYADQTRQCLVRTAGVEPAQVAPRDFKSLASTSFATSALPKDLAARKQSHKRLSFEGRPRRSRRLVEIPR